MPSQKERRSSAVRRLVRMRLLQPIVEFTHAQASSGIVLMACAAIALIWANSPWAESYFHLWETPVGFVFGPYAIEKSLHHWINDGLMAIFFLLVGLEIKREIIVGELSSMRQAALPIAAAIGGMIVPAVLYLVFNFGTPGAKGWGIAMATDIAFSLGALALLGSRAPLSLKVFLTAFAIVDDLGAVLVIALFYTASIDLQSILIAGAAFLGLLLLNVLGVRKLFAFALLGIVLWFALLNSGIHATIAGVLLALTIPARVRLNPSDFMRRNEELLEEFQSADATEQELILDERRQGALRAIASACEEVQMPLQRMEHSLHGWVNLMIMPIFALANAGVSFAGFEAKAIAEPITLGVLVGLVVGKPLGIVGASWLAVISGVAQLPKGITWSQIVGAGILGGIGFTMALFIANLAFGTNGDLERAKVGILVASALAGVAGVWLLGRGRQRQPASSKAAAAGTSS